MVRIIASATASTLAQAPWAASFLSSCPRTSLLSRASRGLSVSSSLGSHPTSRYASPTVSSLNKSRLMTASSNSEKRALMTSPARRGACRERRERWTAHGRTWGSKQRAGQRTTHKETTLDSVRGFIDKETYRNSSLASFSRTQPLLYTHQLYRRVHRKINLLGYIKRTWSAPGPTPRRLPSLPHSAIHSSDHGQPRLHPSLLTLPRTVHHQQGD